MQRAHQGETTMEASNALKDPVCEMTVAPDSNL